MPKGEHLEKMEVGKETRFSTDRQPDNWKNETGVNALNDQLLKSLFVTLDDYACFARLREKRTRVVIQSGN